MQVELNMQNRREYAILFAVTVPCFPVYATSTECAVLHKYAKKARWSLIRKIAVRLLSRRLSRAIFLAFRKLSKALSFRRRNVPRM
jgi:hypothetical protein